MKKGAELLAATTSGVFASKDRGTRSAVLASTVFSMLVASSAAARMFAVDASALLF